MDDAARNTVLVGWEGLEGGRDAFELGRLLAASLDAELLLVSVVDDGMAIPGPADAGAPEPRTVVAPSVAEGLADAASRERSAAVVIGTTHRGDRGRTTFGPIADRLAEIAPCPVAVAPRDYAQRYAARVARVATWFEEPEVCERRIEAAGRIAAGAAGSVWVVAPEGDAVRAERALTAVPSGVPCEIDHDRHDPARRLAAFADSRADLLVARHRHRWLPVSPRCPVLLVGAV